VVGLGNPGRRYAATRHNVGFMVLEALRERWRTGAGRKAFSGWLWEARVGGPGGPRKVLLLAPQTYMNCSGQAARELAAFHKAEPADVLVVLDDLALPPGRLRARASGSAGGHKGLADVLRALGTEQVPRLRIGIGPAPAPVPAEQYVLTKFGPDEAPVIEAAVARAAEAVEDWVRHDIEFVAQKYNRKDEP